MNNLNSLAQFKSDVDEIGGFAQTWKNRPQRNNVVNSTEDKIYFDSYEPNLLMLKGVEAGFDFYLKYQDFIIEYIDNYGLNHSITNSIIQKYIKTIFKCLNTYFEYQYYPYPFGKSLNSFKRDYWYIKKFENLPYDFDKEIKDFRRENWENLFDNLQKADYLIINLSKVYNAICNVRDEERKYLMTRTLLEDKYYSPKQFYALSKQPDPFKLIPYEIMKTDMLRESNQNSNHTQSKFNRLFVKIMHFFK